MTFHTTNLQESIAPNRVSFRPNQWTDAYCPDVTNTRAYWGVLAIVGDPDSQTLLNSHV
jgi:hypothetical protein